MVDSPAHVAIVPDVAAPTPATPRVVPTVSQPVRTNWGAFAEQFLVHETPMIKAGVNAGLALVESVTPMGWAIRMFCGSQVVDGLVQQGLTVLEGIFDAQAVTTDAATHPLYAYVLNMINHSFPNLAAALEPKLDELIKAGLAKVGIAV